MEESNSMEENKQTESPKPVSNKMDDSKIIALLSYLSVLCLIPFFAKKDDDFAYFHAKQGLVLFGFEIAVYIISRIIFGMLIGSLAGWGMLSIWSMVFNLINLGLLVLSVIGIVNVLQNKKTELPLIGKFANNLKF